MTANKAALLPIRSAWRRQECPVVAPRRVERKLAAILAADVAGYSRLMGLDEVGTARRLREHQAAIATLVDEHGGRIVKVTGDAMLLDLSSGVAAVECAMAVQRLLGERNENLPHDRKMALRIGINVGDVMVEGDDLLGEEVNIAARLESLAEPGGIYLSRAVYEQTKGRVAARFVDLGEQQLKNIAEPVHIYAIRPEDAEAQRQTAPANRLSGSEAPRLSIVVLPFLNLGGDAHDDHFVDGITESLTTDLSRLPAALVVARNSAFSYKDRAIDVKQIGRELGVRYALEGSVQHGPNRLRVNVQLVDAESGSHLWAERFDRDRGDLFKLQDEIVTRLARELDEELIAVEARRAERAPSSDALDLFFRGWAAFNRAHNPANLIEARELFHRSLKLDHTHVDALVGRAMVDYTLAATYVADDRAACFSAAEADATRALALAPNHARAHAVLGYIYTSTDRPELGIGQVERALALDPNLTPCHASMGWAKVMLGRADEAEAHFAHALRVSPRDTFAYGWCYMAGTAKLLLGRSEDAVIWLRRSVEANHGYPIAHFTLAAALALLGKAAEARAATAAGLTLSPLFTIARYRIGVPSRNPTYLAQREHIYEGLRRAGVPESGEGPHSAPVVPAYSEASATASPRDPARPEFAAALKAALRNYGRPDLLAENTLLRSHLFAQSDCVGVPELKQLLSKAVETLFASPRDEKLRRVIELTYFRPAPKQEATAERLGMAFGTYRRHLTTALFRLTKWLFERELEAVARGAVPKSPLVSEAQTHASLRERLSIVVLPFLSLSQDEAVDYLVDGIADGLMTSLSRALPGSFVISRSTAFTYRGRQVPVRQVGQELNVRYVLEGSMLADASRIRLNVQLIDAATEEQRWAERFDKERKDILQLQDEIVARLSRSIGIEMIRSEAARPPGTGSSVVDAVDLAMRGQAIAADIRRKESAAEAALLFRQALALDPDNVEALVGLASTRNFQVLNLYELREREALLAEAESLLEHAIVLAPDHIGVLKARAVLWRARGRFAEAVIAVRAVMALNPGEPTAYRELGLNKLYLGETSEAADWFRRADNVAPRDLERWTWLQGLGRALMQMGEDAQAVEVLRLALDSNPNHRRCKALLAAAQALAGDIGGAKLQMAEFAGLDPGLTARRFARERSSVPLEAVSQVYLSQNERILEGLRLAGMPA
ncbi:MAG: hypothetical protein JO172_01725 [Hyphomicrobiales bacterium]|nr:hypothetical protein [Hyphomicrobiales bacterium]